jgi:hypothetical protein
MELASKGDRRNTAIHKVANSLAQSTLEITTGFRHRRTAAANIAVKMLRHIWCLHDD